MEPDYIRAESTIKPPTLEITESWVYLRKDLHETIHNMEKEQITYWTYQEAVLTPEQFEKYVQFMIVKNTATSENDSKNIGRIVAKQETADSNQLAIMEAIADLYDVVVAMM